MAIKTYSINEDVAEKFKQQTPEQETSNVLQQLMEDYINETPSRDIQIDLKKTGLTRKQQRLLDLIVEENRKKIGTTKLYEKARSSNIYGSSHHFGNGLKAIVKSDSIPYTRDGDKIVPERVECGCGSAATLNVLIGNTGECLKCGKTIVRL